MNLIIPMAMGHHSAFAQAFNALALPQLAKALQHATCVLRLGSDEASPDAPHELALAHLQGWPLEDGAVPMAAHMAGLDGLTVSPGQAWGLVSPCHWQASADDVRLGDPAALQLSEAEARELHAGLSELFEARGLSLHLATAQRWYATGEPLRGLREPSLARVAGRSVQPWLARQRGQRWLRALQNEAQMFLHNHPVNQRREAAGLYSVNSFWLSGVGAAPAANLATAVHTDSRLLAPALAGDLQAWGRAWQALDAEVLPRWLQAAATRGEATLALCGERQATLWQRRPRSFLQRLRRRLKPLTPQAALASL